MAGARALKTFGKYQLIKKLATGGMAEVFLARQSMGGGGDGRNVVVKRILPHLADDPEFIRMFQNEARVASKFSHPNIVQIFDYGEEAGTGFIAMELIHGEDLGKVMKQAWSSGKWIARPLAIRIIASACEGLFYAHTRRDDDGRPLHVVHRDISPQNILISFDGTVKLVDFGIAKAAGQLSNTKSGAIKGKFAYMAPEQAGGKEIDARADIFALGLVFYELLTGVRPLKRDSELATLQAALACDIQPPSEVAEMSSELDGVVMRALAKNPDDRYPDARAFQIALEEFLAAERLVASSVQISELMETLFADRVVDKEPAPTPAPVRKPTRSVEMPAAPPRRPTREPVVLETPKNVVPAVIAPKRRRLLGPLLGIAAFAVGGVGVMFYLRPAPIVGDGVPLLLTVTSSPPTHVIVYPADPSRPPVDLGQTPLERVSGVFVKDTVVLEGTEQCLRHVVPFPYGGPNEVKTIEKRFANGSLKLTTTPAIAGLSAYCFGQSLGDIRSMLTLYDGQLQLELRGPGLTKSVPFEVTVVAGKVTSKTIDVRSAK